jgi:hypothetical protein
VLPLFLLSFVLGGCAVSVEEPKFTTTLKDGDFQLRDYPPLTVAEVRVSGGQWGAANRGFRLLANYIFSGNAKQQKIEMTAPVTQQRIAPQDLPVNEQAEGNDWIVRFIMPAGFTPATLPSPNDRRVKLLEMPATRYAVVAFSGWALPFIVRSETKRLQRWVQVRQLQPTGPISLAQYDPPWTIWFLRRNELMEPVAR